MTIYNQQGFPIPVTQPVGASAAVKHYDEQGFLITANAPAPTLSSRTTQAPVPAEKDAVSAGASKILAAQESATSPGFVSTTTAPTGAATRLDECGRTGTVLIVCGLMFSNMFLF